MTVKFVTVPDKRLASSILSTDTSFRISNILGWDAVALTSAPFGTVAYAVFRNSSNTAMELMEIDSSTIASTNITINKRGLKFDGDLTTQVAANKLLWVKGDTIISIGTNPPQIYQYLKEYIDGIAIAGAPNASLTAKGLVESATTAEIDAGTAAGSTGADLSSRPDQLAASIYNTRLPTANQKAGLAGVSGTTPSSTNLLMDEMSMAGMIFPFAGRTAPGGSLLCDGSLVARASYPRLFSVICPSGTVTVTIATPGVFTKTTHGYIVGDKLHFTTTGALPTGLSTNTDYYVISAGLTADAFQVALTPGGAAVNTSGSQSGVHTVYASAWGKGDGSSTFALPDLRGKMPIGLGAASTILLPVEAANVTTGTDTFTIPNSNFPLQGQPVTLTTSGGLPSPLLVSTTYYVIRTSSTTIKLAATQADANAITPVPINITTQGTGIHTITYTLTARQIVAEMGGEENHGLSTGELAGHFHAPGGATTSNYQDSGSGSAGTAGVNMGFNARANTALQGSDSQHNNLPPFVVMNYIIKT